MKLRVVIPLLCIVASARGEAVLTFEKDVRPILKTHCTHCHGEEEKPEGGVDLRLRRFMDRKMEDGGAMIAPGDAAKSGLVHIVRSGEMPEKGKPLTEAQIAIIEQWINQGAKTAKTEPVTLAPGPLIADEDRDFWSFQPVKRPAAPRISNSKSPIRNPIDAFVQKQLAEKKLDFAPEADRRTLIRRVTLDLTGLLPTPEEVSAFLSESDSSEGADKLDRAYERLVDRLLASKAYGERWARHWLDVVGYADSNGSSEADSERPQAWRYRDYVIRSLNEDKPWNQFIQEQLAGDELAGATHGDFQAAVLDDKRRDQLIATAFLRMAPDGTGDAPADPKLAANQVIAEEMKVLSSSLLGLTVGCAQCHDHRHDPITQADYYKLRAVFDPAYNWQSWRTPANRMYSLYSPEDRKKAAEIEEKAKAIETDARAMSKKFLDEIFEVEIKKVPEAEQAAFRVARDTPVAKQTPEQKALIKKYPSALATYSLDLYDKKKQDLVDAKMAEAKKLRETKPAEGFVMALMEVKGQAPASNLFYRGDHEQAKQAVAPGEIGILAKPQIEPFKPASVSTGSSGRRLAYAQWLTSGHHPLVARVLVNRFWMNHMGRGIVNTPGDFGTHGDRPTHPELLDWLADEFVKGGWKLKPLHRAIVLSTTYRQSSTNAASHNADPDNKFYARFKVSRLDAETLRDSMLAVTDALVESSYGPPSSIGIDPQGRVIAGIDKGTITSHKVESAGANDYRRSIYIQVRRSKPVTILDTFDAPAMQPNCELRAQTTVAPQSLLLMNDVFVLDNSLRLARQLEAFAPKNPEQQIQRAWELLYSQTAEPAEVQRCLAYLDEQTKSLTQYHHDIQHPKGVVPNPPQEALASLCQVLCSSNRFLYVE